VTVNILPHEDRWQRVWNEPLAFSVALNANRLHALHRISIIVAPFKLEGRADLSRMVKVTSSREPRIPQMRLSGMSPFA
jgi:hypothetical protein